jgi:glutathionylspermidine synthase
VAAVELVVHSEELLDAFEIPAELRHAVRTSWEAGERGIIGRFDFLVNLLLLFLFYFIFMKRIFTRHAVRTSWEAGQRGVVGRFDFLVL